MKNNIIIEQPTFNSKYESLDVKVNNISIGYLSHKKCDGRYTDSCRYQSNDDFSIFDTLLSKNKLYDSIDEFEDNLIQILTILKPLFATRQTKIETILNDEN